MSGDNINEQILEPSSDHVFDGEFSTVSNSSTSTRKKKTLLIGILGLVLIAAVLVLTGEFGLNSGTSPATNDVSPEERLLQDASSALPPTAQETTTEAATISSPPPLADQTPLVDPAPLTQAPSPVQQTAVPDPLKVASQSQTLNPAPETIASLQAAIKEKEDRLAAITKEATKADKSNADLLEKVARLEAANARLQSRVDVLEKSAKHAQPHNTIVQPPHLTNVTASEKEEFRGAMGTYGIQVIMTDGLIMKINGKDLEFGPGKALPGMKGRFVRGIPESKTVVTEKAIYYFK